MPPRAPREFPLFLIPGVPGQRRRLARRSATTSIRAGSNTSSACTPRRPGDHDDGRYRRRDRLPGRRGKPRHALHVHDDEPGPGSASASEGVGIADRAYQQALAFAPRSASRAAASARRASGMDAIIVHPGRQADAAADARHDGCGAQRSATPPRWRLDVAARAKDAKVRGRCCRLRRC